MKYIKIFEQYITEAKKFKIGDMWSNDFDYAGMLAAGLKVNVNTPTKKLNKLFDSFTDVNYHTAAKDLGNAIDWIEVGDKKGASKFMDMFHKAVKKEIKLNEAKNYMNKIDLKDFKKIKKGSKIQYMGGPVEVMDNNGYVLKLKGKDGKIYTVNKGQFDHGGRIAEAKFNKKKLMKAMKKDDGMVQLGTGEEYVIYNPNNGNDDNTDMWKDKVIFGLDQDGEEHEIEYSDIVSYNESSSKDGGDKSNGHSHEGDHKSKNIIQHWKDTYGEDFHSKYPAVAKILKQRPGIDKRELKRIWDETYGENFEEQYPALYNKLD